MASLDSLTLITTEDGSATCLHPQHHASYRSTSGAIQEVRHVFLESTIAANSVANSDRSSPIRVLEFGFGLGTSFATTVRFAELVGRPLFYYAIDREPVLPKFAQHPDAKFRALAADLLLPFANDDGCEKSSINQGLTTATLFRSDFRSFSENLSVDAIFFDPFGPKVNPESWTKEVFLVAASHLSSNGRLATYSAAGHVRRAMAAAGLLLATRPGPGRKKEITVAAISDDALLDFERLSMARYLPKIGDK